MNLFACKLVKLVGSIGGQKPGKKGGGRCMGGGSKGVGSGRNRRINATLCNILQLKKRNEAGANDSKEGIIKGYRKKVT